MKIHKKIKIGIPEMGTFSAVTDQIRKLMHLR